MDLYKIKAIIQQKVCPKCSKGIVKQTGYGVYICDDSECNEEYDLSSLSEEMIRMLMDKVLRPGNGTSKQTER